ncbi:MAG: OsmC family protein [Saprospiraceae bacterium]|nr:OsmC family protein [Saprospiraceae bacterium]
MVKKHQYKVDTIWSGNRGSGTMDYRSYDRNFTLKMDGKADILGSSDSSFSGDRSLHNPEDLLLAAVSSCHMLWYLHLCSTHGIIVLEYTDHASGVMEEEIDGSGKFTEMVLSPDVLINNDEDIELAEKLHYEAGKMCFIANSLNFPIQYKPRFRTS